MTTPNGDTITPPHIEHIRPIDVTVERRAQRSLDQRRVDAIVLKFRMDSVGVPAVHRRSDGTIVAIDGQHRMAALIAKGLGEHPLACQVYEGLTIQQEAALFLLLNDSKNVTSVDLFRIAVTKGDPIAVKAEKALRLAGWTIEPKKRNTMRSLSTVYNAQERDSMALKRALTLLATAWGATPDSGNATLLSGTFAWCMRYGAPELDIEWDALPPRLGKISGGAKMFLAEARANADVRNIPRPDSVADKLTNLYNQRRRTRFAPAWEITHR